MKIGYINNRVAYLISLKYSQYRYSSLAPLMEHHKHLSCLGIAHLRDYRVRQLSCLYFPTARAHLTAIDKEYFACVGILFDFQLLNSLLGFELGYLPCLDKFQIAFHTTNINFKLLWRGTIPTPSAGRGHVVIGANVCG